MTPMVTVRRMVGADGVPVEAAGVADARTLLETGSALVWIDVDRRDPDALAELSDVIPMHPLAIEDAVNEHQRPIFSRYGDTFFLVMYELSDADATSDDGIDVSPVGFFVGENYVVTVRDTERSALDDVAKRWMHHRSAVPDMDAGFLLYTMLDVIVDEYFPVLERFGERLDELESVIEDGAASESLQGRIHPLRRTVMRLRRILAPEREVLNELLRRESPLMSEETMAYVHDVYDHLLRVLDWLDSYRELASALFETHLAMASHKLDQVMRTLTMASIILMVSSLIAGIYGMNFQNMPELGWQFGYPMAIGLMVVLATALLLVFRWRKWI